MLSSIARRTMLARAAAALAAVPTLPVLARRRKKKPTKTAFRLVTGCKAQGGCACHACKLHAANKLFASKATVVRAHPGCDCRVDSLSLPPAVWVALFQPPGLPATQAVDKRDPRVQQILD